MSTDLGWALDVHTRPLLCALVSLGFAVGCFPCNDVGRDQGFELEIVRAGGLEGSVDSRWISRDRLVVEVDGEQAAQASYSPVYERRDHRGNASCGYCDEREETEQLTLSGG